jgi:hypothetical protein
MKITRLCAALLLPLLLSGCFLLPGAFTSALDLRKNGDFTFSYKGEVIFQSPDDIMKSGRDKPRTWVDARAHCFKDNSDPTSNDYDTDEEALADTSAKDDDNRRPCTAAEIATVRKPFETAEAERLARKMKESSDFGAMFGFSPADDEANRKYAAALMKYEGWRSVSYRGKGVFDVDYQLSSKVSHDFIFPLFPQVDIIIPFVQLRKREGGLMVNAPALVGGGLKALASKARALGQSQPSNDIATNSVITRGTFTLITDGEILTNNTDDGPKADPRGRKLVWDIDPSGEKIPEALIKLK